MFVLKEIRIRFSKTGRAKFISHLDLMRTMTRAVRRAAIPVWYTEGFNRHPYLKFASPLSLGFEGLDESMDVRLIKDMPAADIVDRLNRVLPDGLRVHRAGEPVMKLSDIAFARYRMNFKDNNNNLSKFVTEQNIIAKKRTKKGLVRDIELSPFLNKADLIKNRNDNELCLILPCGSETINPALVVTAYEEYIEQCQGQHIKVLCDIARLALLNGDGHLFV